MKPIESVKNVTERPVGKNQCENCSRPWKVNFYQCFSLYFSPFSSFLKQACISLFFFFVLFVCFFSFWLSPYPPFLFQGKGGECKYEMMEINLFASHESLLHLLPIASSTAKSVIPVDLLLIPKLDMPFDTLSEAWCRCGT